MPKVILEDDNDDEFILSNDNVFMPQVSILVVISREYRGIVPVFPVVDLMFSFFRLV
jgi:hypothetical protein